MVKSSTRSPFIFTKTTSDKSNKELIEELKALSKRVSELGKTMEELNDRKTPSQETTWQTVDVADNAIADFAWSQLSDPVKANLETFSIYDFSDLVYFNSRPFFHDQTSLAAKSAYCTIHKDVLLVYTSVSELKKRTKEESNVAHPAFTAEHLETFMKKLHFACSGSEHPVFDHIRTSLLPYIA